MKFDLQADIIIYQDNSPDLSDSKKFIEQSNLDNDAKKEYLSMIQIKYALDKILSPREKFLLEEYFSGFKLKELSAFYKVEDFELSKSAKSYRKIFAKACFKFLLFVELNPDILPRQYENIIFEIFICSELNIKSKLTKLREIYESILRVNTYRKNIFKVEDSKEQGAEYFRMISQHLYNYNKINNRAFLELNPKIRECLGKHKENTFT